MHSTPNNLGALLDSLTMIWGLFKSPSPVTIWLCEEALNIALRILKAQHFTMAWTQRNKEHFIMKGGGWGELKQNKVCLYKNFILKRNYFLLDIKLITAKFCFKKCPQWSSSFLCYLVHCIFISSRLSKLWLREAILCTLLLSHIIQNKPF